MISILAGTTNGPLNVRWMPCSNARYLAKTFVGLSREFLCSPSTCNTLETMTFGDSNTINHLIFLKYWTDIDRFFKKTFAKIHFVRHTATIDLNLHQMSFLLLQRCLAYLCMSKDTDDSAVLLNTFEFAVDGLTWIFRMLLGIFSESLLFWFIPILVEASLDFITQMLSPNSCKRTKATRSLDVSHQTNDYQLKRCDKLLYWHKFGEYLLEGFQLR